ncbi:MAG: hypothetical protein K2J70_05495 [Muribaculaceae bacterium]|nr:hypothetical protein [Muribaculaceae bacterium]
METALITWILIALLSGAVLIYDFIGRYKATHTGSHLVDRTVSRTRILEVGNECDELYIPGDINSRHDSDIIEYDEEMV